MERPSCSNGEVEESEYMKNRRLGMHDLAWYHIDTCRNVHGISYQVYNRFEHRCDDGASETHQSTRQADAESDEEEKVAC
jgi:hypothetical protein